MVKSESRAMPRVLALSDGVYAIAMTLLVLEVAVPQVVQSELFNQLTELSFKLLIYAISFVILGIYWVAHHYMFRVFRHANYTLMWINISHLLVIALVPFAAAFLSQYPRAQVAVIVYGAILGIAAAILYVMWWYATGHRLVDSDLPPGLERYIRRRLAAGPLATFVAIAISFVSIEASIALYAILPPAYILQSGIDRFFPEPPA